MDRQQNNARATGGAEERRHGAYRFPVSSSIETNQHSVTSFRTKLFVALMLVVSVLTGLALYDTHRNVAAKAERDLREKFQAEISSLHKVQAVRNAALTERCRELVLTPRLHAALEDNALDLLYPSAKDELRDLMEDAARKREEANSLQARFYRFLSSSGAIIPPPNPTEVGQLSREAEAQLTLKRLPETQQVGYVLETAHTLDGTMNEVMALPILSTDTE